MGITESMLSYFKNLHGGHKILYVRFSDKEFVFRTLTRGEYKNILFLNDNERDKQDAICNAACLYPEEYDFTICGYAGLPETVSQYIENLSGFSDIDVILNDYKSAKELNSLEIQAMDLIKAFIPEYTYEEMKEWSWQKLMETTVRAEAVARLKGFDWHLEDESEKYKEQLATYVPENRNIIDKMYKEGIDPMIYFADTIRKELDNRKNVVDFPLITSGKWDNGGILDAIKKQQAKRRSNRI
jgi:hypothetical protein